MRDSNSRQPRQPSIRALCAALPLGLTLAACGGSSGGSDAPPVSNDANTAVLTTVGSDFGSGQVALVDLSDETLMSNAVTSTNTISDIAVDTNGEDYYLIERGQADRVSKFDLDNPGTPVWGDPDNPDDTGYSTLEEGEQGSANPYQLVFASDSKAYLLRYGKETAWIVDPTATTEDGFKTGELDLSAYTPSGASVPRMSAGAIVDGKLFIALQRLDGSFQPENTSCVAVFEVDTDQPIDAGQDPDCGSGIPLNGRNPSEIIYQEDVGLLIQNIGAYDPNYSISGVDVIDPETYGVATRVQADQSTGLISNIAVLDAQNGFFLGYDSFGSISLRAFNPTTGDVDPNPVSAELEEKDLRDVVIGPNDRLWVANAESNIMEVVLLDPMTGMVATSVTTDLLPTGIDFASAEN